MLRRSPPLLLYNYKRVISTIQHCCEVRTLNNTLLRVSVFAGGAACVLRVCGRIVPAGWGAEVRGLGASLMLNRESLKILCSAEWSR